ncbi:histone acetyltransferase type B catalytic subunit [Zophobas morio]|uniref:histone acetyltransferase type B catalytic subunit n=1 Tax=Zophobas morio TaxID=2755281 RepID=UPI003082C734
MAKNSSNEDNDPVVNSEDDEMVQYRKSSLNVVTFRTVYGQKDFETPHKESNSFKPDMAHQIFGKSEMIFGYKQLTISLYYLHNSAKCFADVQFSDKIVDSEGFEADDVMTALNPWLPTDFRAKKEQFLGDLQDENHSEMFGEVIDTFENQGRTYKITICDTSSESFKEFHQRFETYIVWFIDGANFIDLEDTRWAIFYVYEEFEVEGKQYRSPVGFCTVYKFYLYPDLIRPRISQFFILPSHQRRGLGTKLYCTIYNYLLELPDSADITVEEPTEIFQRIRDFCDSLRVYKDLEENKISISTQNQKQIKELLKRHKICKRQAQRVFDVLECLMAHKSGYHEYVKFTESIKTRISGEMQKEMRGSKRVCNKDRAPVVVEPLDKKFALEQEYNRYIGSLEWPTNRLRHHLSKTPK